MESQKRHRCPQCGYDYEPWIEICPDCGVLVETVAAKPTFAPEKGKLDPDKDPRWTVVTNAPNAIIGNLLKSQLEDTGIPVLMQRSPSADIAQFSYNDYVPQDLRVPLHLLEDARQLLNSSPDRSAGAPYWGTDLDDEQEDSPSSPFASSTGTAGNLPDGWTMLPSHLDPIARRQHQSAPDSDATKWGRSGTAKQASQSSTASYDSEYSLDEEPLEADKIRFSQPYEREYYDETSGGQSKWIRIIYGVLLLAISLPFLFQLLQQIFSFLNFR